MLLLTSERDKALLRGILVGGVWNGFLLGGVRGQPVPCRFCGNRSLCTSSGPSLLFLFPVSVGLCIEFPRGSSLVLPLLSGTGFSVYLLTSNTESCDQDDVEVGVGVVKELVDKPGTTTGTQFDLLQRFCVIRLQRPKVRKARSDDVFMYRDYSIAPLLRRSIKAVLETSTVGLLISFIRWLCIVGMRSPVGGGTGCVRTLLFTHVSGCGRSMFIPGALHGLEASFLAVSNLRKLRSLFFKGCLTPSSPFWPMLVRCLACWMVLRALILRSVWSGSGFACFGGISLTVLLEVGRVYRLLDRVMEWCRGQGHGHLLVASATDVGFHWDPHMLGWVRPGLLVLSYLAWLVQHFQSAIRDAWRDKVTADLFAREGFRGGPLLDVTGTLQLFASSHVRER